MGDDGGTYITPHSQAMSEEQLAALLAKLKEDAGLQEKFKGAADLDAAVALAKEAGFDVSNADLLRHQAKQTLELSDEELENVSGGTYLVAAWAVGALVSEGLLIAAGTGAFND